MSVACAGGVVCVCEREKAIVAHMMEARLAAPNAAPTLVVVVLVAAPRRPTDVAVATDVTIVSVTGMHI